MKNGTFTSGTTPNEVILKALGTERYTISLVAEDAQVMQRVVNQGIDSHLEAITGSSFNWNKREMSGVTALDCDCSPKDMLVILRRLLEDDSDFAEHATNLRSSILTTIGIEEV